MAPPSEGKAEYTPPPNPHVDGTVSVTATQLNSRSASLSSTPAEPSLGDDLVANRESDLFDHLYNAHSILVERPSSSPNGLSPMIDAYIAQVGPYSTLAETLRELPETAAILQSLGRGKIDKKKLTTFIGHVTQRTISQIGITDIRYIRSGHHIMSSRDDECEQEAAEDGLKPDYFTSRILKDSHTGAHLPLSLSTILQPPGNLATATTAMSITNSPGPQQTFRQSSRESAQQSTAQSKKSSTITQDCDSLVLANDGSFRWEDVRVLLELKSGSDDEATLDRRKEWGGLILKAMEVLRFQWYRKFVIGFLVCGTKMRMFRIDRSYVLVSLPVEIQGDGGLTLVNCILTGFLLRDTAVGLANDDQLGVLDVDGRPRAMVVVDGKKFVLGDQITWPARDRLISRATTIHMARTVHDSTWCYCYKSSWPSATRAQEGFVLHELRDVAGVVSVAAWDVLPTEGTLTPDQIRDRYQPHSIPASDPISPQGIIPQTTTDDLIYWDRAREHRQTVMSYIADSFTPLKHTMLDLLRVWRSLYCVVHDIAEVGWVHRDLSWENVRFHHRDGGTPSALLIDFDLAAKVDGLAIGSPDRTGTREFMPLEVLINPTPHFRHQELHETEAAFWVGFLTFVCCSPEGRRHFRKMTEDLDFRTFGCRKFYMISLPARKRDWEKWLSGSSSFPPSSSQVDQWNIVRGVCQEILELQFGENSNYLYPPYDSPKGNSRISHQAEYRSVLGKILEVLDVAIGKLEEVSGSS